MRAALVAVIACIALAGCGGRDSLRAARAPQMLFSLSGEPLSGGPLGRPSCEDATAGWLARVDADRDGTLRLDEALVDASAQFARMDLDGDGAVTAHELQSSRLAFLDPRRRVADAEDFDTARRATRRGEPADRGGLPGGPAGPRAVTGGSSLSEAPDPVMAADRNLDFRVTRDEHLARVRARFAALDRDGDGRLDAAALRELCPPR